MLIFINIIIATAALFLGWICYKRNNYNFIYINIIAMVLYQLLIKRSTVYNIMILSIIYIVTLFAIIKIYSNKINNEHNDKILKNMENDFKQFAIKKNKK